MHYGLEQLSEPLIEIVRKISEIVNDVRIGI